MSRGLLATLAAGLIAVGLAVLLLTNEPEAEHAASVLRRSGQEPAGAPGFHGEVTEGRGPAGSATEPVRAEPLTATGTVPESAAPAPAAKPRGPVRRLSGRVVRVSDGTPLIGATVGAVLPESADAEPPESGADLPVTTLAPDGSFELPAVSVDVLRLSVILEDHWPRTAATYPLPEIKGDIAGLELAYDTGLRVRGVVRDTRGAPLAGATAAIPPQPPATTDAAGRFELADVAPDKARLSVTCYAEAPWFMREEQALLLPQPRVGVLDVEFTLAGSGALQGTVLDTAGQPVADTEVKLAASMTEEHGNSAPRHLVTGTGEDGHYFLDHVPEGRYLVQVGTDAFAFRGITVTEAAQAGHIVTRAIEETIVGDSASRRGLAPRWIPDVYVDTGKATRLDVTLDTGATIEGRVTDSGGVPLAGATVTLERLQRWPAPQQNGSSVSYDGSVTITSSGGADGVGGETVLSAVERQASTGDDGTYRFESLAAGEKRLLALDAEQRCAPQKRLLAVQGTARHSGVDFVLSFGLSVRGRVTDPAGAPLRASINVKPAGTQVFTGEGSVTCDDDGWFEVKGLSAGTHIANIYCAGFAWEYREVTPGDPPLTLVLQPAPKVHGLVTDAVTDQPVVRFSLRLATGNSIRQSDDDDHAEGRFTADVNDDQPIAVMVSAIGYEPLEHAGVIPTSTSEAAPLRFRLRPVH